MTPTAPTSGTAIGADSSGSASRLAAPPGPGRRARVGLGAFAILACCGLKLLILAAVSVGSAGAIARTAAIGAGGLALAVAFTAYCIRRRRCGDDSRARKP